jgi:hypothetical protein
MDKYRPSRPLAFVGILLVAACNQAPDPLVGAWDFQTERYGPGNDHVMRGTLVVTPLENGLKCSLATRESHYAPLPGLKFGDIVESSADQECQIVNTNGTVSIQSKVLKASSSSYQADNFTLKLGGDQLVGTLDSATRAPVIFVRRGGTARLAAMPDLMNGRQRLADQEKGWIALPATIDNCPVDYRSPIEPTGAGAFRTWLRFKCGGETRNDYIPYDNYEVRQWVDCNTKTTHWESEVFYDAEGRQVHKNNRQLMGLPVDGPTLVAGGVMGEPIGVRGYPNLLAERFCS